MQLFAQAGLADPRGTSDEHHTALAVDGPAERGDELNQLSLTAYQRAAHRQIVADPNPSLSGDGRARGPENRIPLIALSYRDGVPDLGLEDCATRSRPLALAPPHVPKGLRRC